MVSLAKAELENGNRDKAKAYAEQVIKLVSSGPVADDAHEILKRISEPFNVALGRTCKIVADGPDKVHIQNHDRWIYGKDEMKDDRLTDDSLDTWIGWVKDSYNSLFKVTVTIDLGDTYVIRKIRYNMGNVQRAETWNADKMITPFGEVRTNPGQSYAGAWTEHTGHLKASSVSVTFTKTRLSYPTDFLCIGEVEIYATDE
jgi:hypothetical protein